MSSSPTKKTSPSKKEEKKQPFKKKSYKENQEVVDSNGEMNVNQLISIPYEMFNYKENGPQQDYLFKLIIIGNSAVGKSCLMHRVTTNEFTDDHEVTVGVEFGSLMFKMEETLFKLQIWDTAGQESFQSITKIFYRGAHAVLLTYSIASLLSFQNLPHWFNEIKTQSEPDAIIILVGNQMDRENNREVSYEQGEKFRKDNGIEYFLETSAKTNENVKDAFIMAAKMLYYKHKERIKKAKQNLVAKAQGKKLRREQRQLEKNQSRCNC